MIDWQTVWLELGAAHANAYFMPDTVRAELEHLVDEQVEDIVDEQCKLAVRAVEVMLR